MPLVSWATRCHRQPLDVCLPQFEARQNWQGIGGGDSRGRIGELGLLDCVGRFTDLSRLFLILTIYRHSIGSVGGRDGHAHDRGGFGRRGRRMGHGQLRPLLLLVLLDGPAHGYELIRRLEQRSGGVWRPSPGSVYPTLQLLEEADLLRGRDDDGKRVYEITDSGRGEAEQAVRMGLAARWDAEANPEGAQWADLRAAVGNLHTAARQVSEVADSAQMERALTIVREARQKLYQLLVEG